MPPKLFLDIASPRRSSPGVAPAADGGAYAERGGVTVRARGPGGAHVTRTEQCGLRVQTDRGPTQLMTCRAVLCLILSRECVNISRCDLRLPDTRQPGALAPASSQAPSAARAHAGTRVSGELTRSRGRRAQASISVTDNGSLKLFSRSQLYRFTPEGLECNPSTSGRSHAPEQHSYKVPHRSSPARRAAARPAQRTVLRIRLFRVRQAAQPHRASWQATRAGDGCRRAQIAERDVRILRVLGRGASSVVRPCGAAAWRAQPGRAGADARGAPRQVHKGFYQRGDCFVAVKRINCFEKARPPRFLAAARRPAAKAAAVRPAAPRAPAWGRCSD